MNTATATMGNATGMVEDDEFFEYRTKMQTRFNGLTSNGKLFTTDVTGLYESYLLSLPDDQRQYHNCHCCRHFIERFGGLVTIDEGGATTPVLWWDQDATPMYVATSKALYLKVSKAKVTGVFISSELSWGIAETGAWSHFMLTNPAPHMDRLKAAFEAMAEKKEEYGMVNRALADFNINTLKTALTILDADALYCSDRVKGPAQWLHDLKEVTEGKRGQHRANHVWRAIASAPAGFCHPRSSMTGTLIEDLQSGMDFAQVKRRFDAKMAPLAYMRPKAEATAGNIKRAEEIVAKLGLAPALERRFARLEDIQQTVWNPAPPAEEKAGKGVFDHLLKKEAGAPLKLPTKAMSWVRFRETVLPVAQSITLLTKNNDSYGALVTAVNPDAPPLLQWDHEGARNPVSWYVYTGGSTPAQWGIKPRAKLSCIAELPYMWQPGYDHHGKGVMLVIDGAKDSRGGGSLALFPSLLRASLYEVRSTIESFSNKGTLEGKDEASACGLILQSAQTAWNVELEVVIDGVIQSIRLDRWE